MATAFTTPHHATTVSRFTPPVFSKEIASGRGTFVTFVQDLLEDIEQRPLQDAKLAKHDIFREHILAMSISYFALIVLLIGASVPTLGYLVRNLVSY